MVLCASQEVANRLSSSEAPVFLRSLSPAAVKVCFLHLKPILPVASRVSLYPGFHRFQQVLEEAVLKFLWSYRLPPFLALCEESAVQPHILMFLIVINCLPTKMANIAIERYVYLLHILK